MNLLTSPLLTDLYHLNMIQAYLDHGDTSTAVFEFFVRKLPARRGFLMAAGLEQVLDFLESLRFSDEEISWLAKTGRFEENFLEQLATFCFEGDVHAVPEGRIVFADEPLIRITAPMPQAQLAETRVMNLIHFQTLIASKAARIVLAAPGKVLVDFGLRRAHGAEAGLLAARASYIAGFSGTATAIAEHEFGIPVFGTMAHSFVEAFDSETAAFETFARSRPGEIRTGRIRIAARRPGACRRRDVGAGGSAEKRGNQPRAAENSSRTNPTRTSIYLDDSTASR